MKVSQFKLGLESEADSSKKINLPAKHSPKDSRDRKSSENDDERGGKKSSSKGTGSGGGEKGQGGLGGGGGGGKGVGEELKWDHKLNLIGRAVKDPLLHICEVCSLPILIYGRMVSFAAHSNEMLRL